MNLMTLQEWCEQNDRLDLLNEWHPTKNGTVTPNDVTIGSSKKVWWLLPYDISDKHFDFEWDDTVWHRIHGRNCPFLSGKRIFKGFNDLASNCPNLLKEWNYDKNIVSPDEIYRNSHQKIWWKCDKGHEWYVSVKDRTQYHTGCPVCSGENQTSFPEQAILYYVGQYFSDTMTRDSHLNVELDIFVPSKSIAIEYDGYFWHKSSKRKLNDIRKNTICKANGITLIRVRENGLSHLDSCIEISVSQACADDELSLAISKILQHLSVEEPNIDIARDRTIILNNYINQRKKNSLLIMYPNVAQEWHPSKNGNLSPDLFDYGSNKKVWWLGQCGHEWQDSITHRTGMLCGCPYCRGLRVLEGFNDLASQNPDLAEEWNYDKNTNLKPTMITLGSGKKVWWKCNLGHEWQATVPSRSNGCGCPYCANDLVWKGFNDLAFKYPSLAKEWNYDKNANLLPQDVVYGSSKKVWWKCPNCGYEWKTAISMRTRNGHGCPMCQRKTAAQNRQKTLISNGRSLLDCYPNVAKEWHPTKNGELLPSQITYGSRKKVWWLGECGHEWFAEINNRVASGCGCPICEIEERRERVKHCRRFTRAVECIETGQIYASIKNAASAIGIDMSNISHCLSGRQSIAGGYHWKYAIKKE